MQPTSSCSGVQQIYNNYAVPGMHDDPQSRDSSSHESVFHTAQLALFASSRRRCRCRDNFILRLNMLVEGLLSSCCCCVFVVAVVVAVAVTKSVNSPTP